MATAPPRAAPAGPPPLVAAPATVSQRRHLRDALPELYRESDFTARFLLGFEETLDPIVAVLDSLTAYFDAELAPGHALAGVASWLGVDEVEALDTRERRAVLLRAGDLGRLRGTRAGLQLALELLFPRTPLRIVDHGGVTVAEDPDMAVAAPEQAFDVYCDAPLPEAMQQAVNQTIERWKPVHVRHRLRVRTVTSPGPVAVPGGAGDAT